MGCGKDLGEGKKVLVIKEIAKVKKNEQLIREQDACPGVHSACREENRH